MPYKEWAGASGRDLLLDTWATQRWNRVPGHEVAPEFLTLLGAPGSGKTTLLRHLQRRAAYTYCAYVDCAQLTPAVQDPVELLGELVFQLSTEAEGRPALKFPAYAALRLALGVNTLPTDWAAAVREMSRALSDGSATRQAGALFGRAVEGLNGVTAAVALGAFSLISDSYGAVKRWQIERQLKKRAEDTGNVRSFLVGLSHQFAMGTREQQDEARETLTRLFLGDLRRAYSPQDGGSKERNLRCLILLDNVDDERGQAFLRMLSAARPDGPEADDPLIVVATASSPPATIAPLTLPHASGLSGCWGRDSAGHERFTALRPQGSGFTRVAGLRRLHRSEVIEQCGPVVRGLPDVPGVTERANWLGLVLYDLTGGHPRVTRDALRALTRFGDDTPVDVRLREVFAPQGQLSVTQDSCQRHFGPLPATTGTQLRRVAAAALPGRSLAVDALWAGMLIALTPVADLLGDELRMDTVEFEGAETVVLPPAVRRCLLQQLAGQPGVGAGTWHGTHSALRDDSEQDDAAYHQLALGDVPAATRHLDTLFQQVKRGDAPLDTWCRALSWIQRAPHPRLHMPTDAVQEYEATVERFRDRLEEHQLPLARLLVAGQLTRHPDADPCAGLWSDPLWDPTARLWEEIHLQLHELRTQLTPRNALLLDQRIKTYAEEPW